MDDRSSVNGTLIKSVTFDYDVFGNRIRRKETNGSGTTVSENRYLYDGWKVSLNAGSRLTNCLGSDAESALGNRPRPP